MAVECEKSWGLGQNIDQRQASVPLFSYLNDIDGEIALGAEIVGIREVVPRNFGHPVIGSWRTDCSCHGWRCSREARRRGDLLLVSLYIRHCWAAFLLEHERPTCVKPYIFILVLK